MINNYIDINIVFDKQKVYLNKENNKIRIGNLSFSPFLFSLNKKLTNGFIRYESIRELLLSNLKLKGVYNILPNGTLILNVEYK